MTATPQRPERGQHTLDYLARAGKLRPMPAEDTETEVDQWPDARPVTPPELELFAARAVLNTIRQLESTNPTATRGVHLSDCGRKIGMTGDVLFPLARRLESAGLLRTEESDSFGDNLVTITDEAIRALDSEDPQSLANSLQLEERRGGPA